MNRLMLEVTRYAGASRWDWTLSDLAGRPLAGHRVELDPAAVEYAAFTDLDGYLAGTVRPDRPLGSEAELLDRVGRWLGAAVFGPVGPAVLAHAPVVVQVRLPVAARDLLFRPLELAVVGSGPLAVQDVSLVYLPPGPAVRPGRGGAADRMRMLAVFGGPAGGEAAPGPREQRHALARQLDELRHRAGAAIDLRVLQYGLTRDRLAAALAHGDGWDVVHVSWPAGVDALVLDGPDGRPDPMPLTELLGLLRPGRGRLALLVLAAGSPPAAPREALLAHPVRAPSGPPGAAVGGGVPALADEAVRRLGCAVLALRYPVEQDFAIALAGTLYDALFGAGEQLPRAVQLALPVALGDRPVAGVPPRSVAAPALFGARCADLRLRPPPAVPMRPVPATAPPVPTCPPATIHTGQSKLAGFPPPPDRFVGRAAALTRAAAVLAGRGTPGLLLAGPAGIGTTAAAVELGHRQQTDFGLLVWHRAGVATGARRSDPVRRFAACLDRVLPGLRLADAVGHPDRLAAALPRLTELAERWPVLVVLDGVDALLGQDGRWRDPAWPRLVGALLGHDGLSRLVLTGRRRPAGPHRLAVEVLPPLTVRDAVLLARQLPRLGALIRGRSGLPAGRARELVAAALTAARGVPAAIWAADRRLSTRTGGSPGPTDPEYLTLLDRWMAEID
jgi:hypothetical protein